MAEIFSTERDLNAEVFLKLRSLEFKHLVVGNTLVAGFNVQHKLEGPVMLVVGFLPRPDRDYYYENGNARYINGTWTKSEQVHEKVQLNTSNLTLPKIFPKVAGKFSGNYIPTYLFYTHIQDFDVADRDDSLAVVCKYWSESKQDYDYRFERLFELELVKD